jgi:hypothetical protein
MLNKTAEFDRLAVDELRENRGRRLLFRGSYTLIEGTSASDQEQTVGFDEHYN